MVPRDSLECLGLPATGKSWVADNISLNNKPKAAKISLGINLYKIFEIVVGIVFYTQLITTYFLVFKLNKESLQIKSFLKRVLVSFHRLGLLKLHHKKGVLIDEGPVQSVWAVFFSLEITDENIMYLNKLLLNVCVSDKIIYVSTPRKLHFKRMAARERKHQIFEADEATYLLSRQWLFLIVVELRKRQIEIQYYCNC